MYSKIMVMLCTLVWIPIAAAQDAVRMSVLTSMAEEELQAETGYVPDQQSASQQRALAHQLNRAQQSIQATTINSTPIQHVEIIPQPAMDLPELSPLLQQYVHAIAAGLTSSDPTQGISVMLQSAGISPQQASSRERSGLVIQFSNIQLNQAAQQFTQPPR